jgi:hypothetical protein
MASRLAAAASGLKASGASKVVSGIFWERRTRLEVRGPVRFGGASEGFALGQAHPIRTRQGRMVVVVAVMMRETAHGAGSIREL